MPSVEIKSYQVGIYAGERVNRARATITLLDDKNNTRAYLHFVDQAVMPAGNTATNGNTPTGFYPADRYQDVIDLLRNEKPVYLWLSGASDVGLTTAPEPVGETEGAGLQLFKPIKF